MPPQHPREFRVSGRAPSVDDDASDTLARFGSDQACLRHETTTAYRCFLPDLTGFAGRFCTGPDRQRRGARASIRDAGPREGIQPRWSGLRVQGTAGSPPSTADSMVSRNPRSGAWRRSRRSRAGTRAGPAAFYRCENFWTPLPRRSRLRGRVHRDASGLDGCPPGGSRPPERPRARGAWVYARRDHRARSVDVRPGPRRATQARTQAQGRGAERHLGHSREKG